MAQFLLCSNEKLFYQALIIFLTTFSRFVKIATMRQNIIAKEHKVSQALVSYIISGDRYTDNIALAVDIAKLTGKKPIIYLCKNLQKIAAIAYPNLTKVQKAE
jgi:hypothetical protein